MLGISKKYVALMLAGCIQLNGGIHAAIAEEESKSETAAATVAPPELEKEKFEYKLDNQDNTPRDDPFYPFLSQEAKKKEQEDAIIEGPEVLTGMRRFEPGQLKLVAVMSSPAGGRIAMAEDSNGTGYVLKEGMLIGRWGKIERIEDGQLIVIETKETQAGRKITNNTAMRLKKEEEK